jgi:Bacterial TSP3 repeat
VLHRLQGSLFGLRRRLAAVGSGFVDTFLRDNKVIPLVLALLALLVFAWIVAGIFLTGPDEEPASNRANVAQSQDPGVSDPPAPEVENPNVESYAAYQFKDPFRQLLPPAEATTPTTTPETTGEATTGETTGREPGGGGAADTDGDGLPDRRESALGLDPNNPDTDGDGIQDGAEASDGGSRGTGRDDAGRDRGGDRTGRGGGLFDSGGDLSLP